MVISREYDAISTKLRVITPLSYMHSMVVTICVKIAERSKEGDGNMIFLFVGVTIKGQ